MEHFSTGRKKNYYGKGDVIAYRLHRGETHRGLPGRGSRRNPPPTWNFKSNKVRCSTPSTCRSEWSIPSLARAV